MSNNNLKEFLKIVPNLDARNEPRKPSLVEKIAKKNWEFGKLGTSLLNLWANPKVRRSP